MALSKCKHKGCLFQPRNANQTICDACRDERKKELQHASYLRNKANVLAHATRTRKKLAEEGAPAKVEPYKPKPRPLLITDSEQRLIDRYCDSLDNETLQCKVYQPGSEEFARVAAEIMSAPHNTKIVEERIITAPMQLIRRRYAAQQEG